jgi:hypothetical protein
MPISPAIERWRQEDPEFGARSWKRNKTLSQKQNKNKRAGGTAQVIEQ